MGKGGKYLHLNYRSFTQAVGFFAGWQRDDGPNSRWNVQGRRDLIDDIVQSGVRQFYFPPPLGDGQAPHAWGFLKPTRTINLHPAVSSTLSIDPVLVGNQITLQAVDEVFESTMVGLTLEFTFSKQRFTITEFLSTSRVNVSEISEQDQDTPVGDYERGTLAERPGVESGAVVSSTNISDATNTPFHADMVGDLINFSGTTYSIIQYFSSTKVRVQGDASAESGAFTIDRSATSSVLPFGGVGVQTTAPVFREDMATDSDTITFTVSGNIFTIDGFSGSNFVTTTTSTSGELATDTITIKKTGVVTTVTAVFSGYSLRANEGIFRDAQIDMFVAFEGSFNAYQIVSVTDAHRITIGGDASNESGSFGVVHQIGDLSTSTAMVYVDPATTLTASASIFTTALAPAGKFLHFKVGGNKYPITSRTNDTVVVLAGNAAGEGGAGEPAAGKFWIAGAITQSSDDAFTLPSTGANILMPPEFAGSIIGDVTFDPTTGASAMVHISEGQIRALRQRNTLTGRPRFFALRPRARDESHADPSYTPSVGRRGQLFEMMVHPESDITRALTFQYTAIPLTIGDDFPIPLGGAIHGEAILASCLAEADSRLNDERGEKWEQFMIRLAASVAIDKNAMTAEHLGYNSNGQDIFGVTGISLDSRSRCDLTPTVTVSGVSV